MPRLTDAHLDDLLALQLTTAWAGESAGGRLGWWKTDLVDREGGGDLFTRLVPRTAAWTGLALARAAARRIDELAREKISGGDDLWTPFHLGFAIDEQLDDRFAYHRSHEHVPSEVLGARFLVAREWSQAAFESMLASLATPKVAITPAGRKIDARNAPPVEAALLLCAALLPIAPAYPLPYIEVKR